MRTHATEELADHLRDRIHTGDLPAGAQLPSISQMVELFGVGKGVAQNAIARLRDEGLLESRHGKGTFVRTSPPANRRTWTMMVVELPRRDANALAAWLRGRGFAESGDERHLWRADGAHALRHAVPAREPFNESALPAAPGAAHPWWLVKNGDQP